MKRKYYSIFYTTDGRACFNTLNLLVEVNIFFPSPSHPFATPMSVFRIFRGGVLALKYYIYVYIGTLILHRYVTA